MQKKPIQLIECNVLGSTYYINMASIIYLESHGHHLTITTISAEYAIRSTLKNFLARLDDKIFYQVHQSYAININYLVAFSHKEVTLQSNKKIPIGRKFKLEFMCAMQDFV